MSERGLPFVVYEVIDGSRTDVTTVEVVVEVIEQRFRKAQPIGVMDRGMVSEANLEWLRRRGAPYLGHTQKGCCERSKRRYWRRTGEKWRPALRSGHLAQRHVNDSTALVV